MRQNDRTSNTQIVVLDGSKTGKQRVGNQQVNPSLTQTDSRFGSTLETEILGVAKLGLIIENELLL